MSCGNQQLVENYGDPHLHFGGNPMAVNEAAMHGCSGECYYGDRWPAKEAIAQSIDAGLPLQEVTGKDAPGSCGCPPHRIFHQDGQPIAQNNSSDPNKRYASPEDLSGNFEVGVGCSNLRCMCPNCHGDCKCPSTCSGDNDPMRKHEVVEPFVGGLSNIFQLQDETLMYLLVGLALFLAWYFMTKRR